AGADLPTQFPLGAAPGAGFADGTGPLAKFNNLTGLWSDGVNFYIADTGNNAIRKAEPAFSAPVLTSIAPANGDQGTSVNVTLSGLNFISSATSVNTDTTDITVSNLSVTSNSSLTATFLIGASSTRGVHQISVSTPEGSSYSIPFTVHLPVITN